MVEVVEVGGVAWNPLRVADLQQRSKAQDRVNEFGVLRWAWALVRRGRPALSQTAGLPRPTAQSAKVGFEQGSKRRLGAPLHAFGRSAEGTRRARRGSRKET